MQNIPYLDALPDRLCDTSSSRHCVALAGACHIRSIWNLPKGYYARSREVLEYSSSSLPSTP